MFDIIVICQVIGKGLLFVHVGRALPVTSMQVERDPKPRPWRADPDADSYIRARNDILRAAERVVNRVGIAGLRIGEVALEVNCTRQNVHRYFATRRDLIEAVLVHRSARLAEAIAKQLEGHGHPVDRLVDGIIAAADIAAGDRHLQSYYSGASADRMLTFITSSPMLRAQVAANIGQLADEIGLRAETEITVPELTDWFFRIFVGELVWTLTTERSIEERGRNLRVLMASPLSSTSQSTVLSGPRPKGDPAKPGRTQLAL